MCSYWGDRTNTGLCEPLWSIRQNCQLMAKLEMMHILQAQAELAGTQGCHNIKWNGKLVMHQNVS